MGFMICRVLVHLIIMCKPGDENMRSCLRMCLEGSNDFLLCGAMLDILKIQKNAVRKIALNRRGSVRRSHAMEIRLTIYCIMRNLVKPGGRSNGGKIVFNYSRRDRKSHQKFKKCENGVN